MQQQVILRGEETVWLEGVSLSYLLGTARSLTERFFDVVTGHNHGVLIRRSKRLIVGRVAVGQYDVVVPPPFAAELFVPFVMYALRIDLHRYSNRPVSSLELGGQRGDLFLILMASLLVAESELLLQGHVSKSYLRRDGRGAILRGRVLWSRNFARHPVEGWEYEVHEQVTDDSLNRLVLAGLLKASELLSGTPYAANAATQVFVWRQYASPAVPSHVAFELARRGISRLTEHYIPALALCRAITLGTAPKDLIRQGEGRLQNIEFSIPALYETFLLRLLAPVAQQLGLMLGYKESDSGALVDGDGEPYRKVEPDIVVYRAGRPVGVIDAKFKPRYVVASQNDLNRPEARVSNEDIYQLYFYQSRLQSISGLSNPPRAVILAPSLGLPPSSRTEHRTVYWNSHRASLENRPSLRVLPVPIAEVLELIRTRTEVEVVSQCMPEVLAELKAMAKVI